MSSHLNVNIKHEKCVYMYFQLISNILNNLSVVTAGSQCVLKPP